MKLRLKFVLVGPGLANCSSAHEDSYIPSLVATTVVHTSPVLCACVCVCVQVSNLVIAHEEAAEGGIASDLTTPVAAVDAAVKNLVVVSVVCNTCC